MPFVGGSVCGIARFVPLPTWVWSPGRRPALPFEHTARTGTSRRHKAASSLGSVEKLDPSGPSACTARVSGACWPSSHASAARARLPRLLPCPSLPALQTPQPGAYLGFLSQLGSDALLLGTMLPDLALQLLQLAFQLPDALQESWHGAGPHQRSWASPLWRASPHQHYTFPIYPVTFALEFSSNLPAVSWASECNFILSLTPFCRILTRCDRFYRTLQFSGSLCASGAFYHRSRTQNNPLHMPSYLFSP